MKTYLAEAAAVKGRTRVFFMLSVICAASALAQPADHAIRRAQRLIVHNAQLITGFAHMTVNYETVEFDGLECYYGNDFSLTYTFNYSEPDDPNITGYATLKFFFDTNGRLNNIHIGPHSSIWVRPFDAATISLEIVKAIVIDSEKNWQKREELKREIAKIPDARILLLYILREQQG